MIANKDPSRSFSAIAYEIQRDWKKVNYAAAPYLSALKSEDFGFDGAKSVVLYFLSNAGSYKGPKAFALKNELRALVGLPLTKAKKPKAVAAPYVVPMAASADPKTQLPGLPGMTPMGFSGAPVQYEDLPAVFSYKVEVQADASGAWTSNAMRFGSEAAAQKYGRDLMMRWMAVREMRVVFCPNEEVTEGLDGSTK